MSEFLKGVFSDGGSPSASRVLTVPHVIVSCFAVVWVTVKTMHIPDAMTLAGLGGFATIHYAVNAARNVLQKTTQQN